MRYYARFSHHDYATMLLLFCTQPPINRYNPSLTRHTPTPTYRLQSAERKEGWLKGFSHVCKSFLVQSKTKQRQAVCKQHKTATCWGNKISYFLSISPTQHNLKVCFLVNVITLENFFQHFSTIQLKINIQIKMWLFHIFPFRLCLLITYSCDKIWHFVPNNRSLVILIMLLSLLNSTILEINLTSADGI